MKKTTKKTTRKTPVVFINGVKATREDLELLWKNFKSNKEEELTCIFKDGDVRFTTK